MDAEGRARVVWFGGRQAWNWRTADAEVLHQCLQPPSQQQAPTAATTSQQTAK